MKLFCHYSVKVFSNTYLVGPGRGGDALLIDPGMVDSELITLIEQNNYYIKTVLITHAHENHIRGIKTLLKIYQAELYGSVPYVYDFPVNKLQEGREYLLSGFPVEVFEIPGHSLDSLVYKIGILIFTGDVLSAGSIGNTPNSYAKNLMINTLKQKILSLPETSLIFPGHGAVSTLKAEKIFNPCFL